VFDIAHSAILIVETDKFHNFVFTIAQSSISLLSIVQSSILSHIKTQLQPETLNNAPILQLSAAYETAPTQSNQIKNQIMYFLNSFINNY
jgi:hypothetical protein